MAVVIEQVFPLGRFQARRWNQPPFDPGSVEWPPSPWRLLRAITARWFQYCRETGEDDVTARDAILMKLGNAVPLFWLPTAALPGPELRQYQPTEVKFTKKKIEPEMKRPLTTLVPDRSQAIPPDEAVFWIWNDVLLSIQESTLLAKLLRRIHYFGRAESLTRLQLRVEREGLPDANCVLSASSSIGASPVLVNTSPDTLVERLLTATGDRMLGYSPVPRGTAWHYAKLPNRLAAVRTISSRAITANDNFCIARFLLDGPVLPLVKDTVLIAERFRAAVMSMFNRCCGGRDEAAKYFRSVDGRYASPTFSGKEIDGGRLVGHSHAHYLPIPDRIDPRFVCQVMVYAPVGFEQLEIQALRRLRDVRFGELACRVQLIGLEGACSLHPRFRGPSTTWTSLTPFIAHRHAKSRGRKRDIPTDPADPRGSFLAAAAQEICQKHGLPQVKATPIGAAAGQLPFYEFRRARRKADNDAYTRAAGYLRLTFSEPVSGPLCLGYNSHFGMGLFTAAE